MITSRFVSESAQGHLHLYGAVAPALQCQQAASTGICLDGAFRVGFKDQKISGRLAHLSRGAALNVLQVCRLHRGLHRAIAEKPQIDHQWR